MAFVYLFNTEINLSTGFCCSSETFCCRCKFDEWKLYGWERQWKHFQHFLAQMVVRAVSEKCQVCHCVITEFRLVWVQWYQSAEAFQNPTLLRLKAHTHMIFRILWKFPVDTMVRSSPKYLLCSVFQFCLVFKWWNGLAVKAPDYIVHSKEGSFSTRINRVLFHRSLVILALIVHKMLHFMGYPSLGSLPFRQRFECALSVFRRVSCEHVKRTWFVRFGFALVNSTRVELAAQSLWWGKGRDGAAGGEFAVVFLDW